MHLCHLDLLGARLLLSGGVKMGHKLTESGRFVLTICRYLRSSEGGGVTDCLGEISADESWRGSGWWGGSIARCCVATIVYW